MANSPARSVLDVGSVIADTYTIEALIGRGGMGSVFLASHNRLPGKQVAIKLLHAELVDADVLARFRREAEIASKLGHPNIVAVHDFNITADGTPYLVLEYLVGESLAQRLVAGPLPIDQAMSIMRQIGGALTAAHREGIVHRDLKPHNIFLIPTEVGDSVVEVAKVLDFGISKIRGSQTVKTQDSALLGTPQYMAPEQATGQHDKVDERTDVFALGAITYEMLIGRPAFSGANIPEVVFKVVYEQPAPIPATIPEHVAHAIRTAMEKDADRRYPTVAAFVEALTGSPLVTGLRTPRISLTPMAVPAIGSNSGKRPDASKSSSDAFANTVGSGDHGPSAAPAPPAVLGSAPTVDSQARGLAGGLASTSVAPAPHRPRGRVIGLAIACLVAIGIAGVFALRSSSREARPQRVAETQAHEPRHASERPPRVDPPKPADTPKPVDPPKPADTPKPVKAEVPAPVKAPTKAPVKTVPPPPEADDPAEDATVREQLQKAEAALASGNYELAQRLANGVINSDARPRQRAQAHSIRGICECVANNNEEAARSNLRALGPFAGPRARLIKACHQHGLLQSVR